MDGSTNNYDFVIDGEQGMPMYTAMMLACDSVDSAVESIYEEIDLMNDGWKGSGYEAFKQNALDVKKHFNDIGDLIKVYRSAVIHLVATDIHDVVLEIKKALDDLNSEE